MYVVSTFEHSMYLELAITKLEQKGVTRNKILAVPLEKRTEERKIFDTIHRSDGISLFDGATATATAFMILGVIYGFVWKRGPIIWGLIGAFAGFLLGFALDFLINKKRKKGLKRKAGGVTGEVVLIIDCPEGEAGMVEEILWEHLALGVSKVSRRGGHQNGLPANV